MHSLRIRILTAILFCLVIGAAIALLLMRHTYQQNVAELAGNTIKQAAQTFSMLEKNDIAKLSSTLRALLANPELKRLYLSGNRQQLQMAAAPLFGEMRRDFQITHWYFHYPEPDKRNFLRVHNPTKHSDTVKRDTYEQSVQSGSFGAGKELGETAFALRVVHPYYDAGKLIGYMELGQEIDEFLLLMKQQTGDDYTMLVKKQYLDQQRWDSVRKQHKLANNWNELSNFVVVNSTQSIYDLNGIEAELADASDTRRLLGTYRKDGQIYARGVFPVYDATGKAVGTVLVQHNIGSLQNMLKENLFNLLGIGLAVLTLVFITLLWVMNRFLSGPLDRIHQLSGILEEMGRGFFEVDITDRTDEADRDNLSRALAGMAVSLRRLRDSITGSIAQARAISGGDYEREIDLLSEQDQLGSALMEMTRQLRKIRAENREAMHKLALENEQKASQDWLKSGQTGFNDRLRGEQNLSHLAQAIVHYTAEYAGAQIGAFYLYEEEEKQLKLHAGYAYTRRKNLSDNFAIGEGLVGQAALEQKNIVIEQVPADYVSVQSALGEAVPANIMVMPFFYENTLKGVLELGWLQPVNDLTLEFLEQSKTAIGIAVHTAQARDQMSVLLAQSQQQSEELQAQSEELQTQQEELRQTNEELEERTRSLEQQQHEIREKNVVLEQTRSEIEKKAQALEQAGRYKSEFLANMSHELRTPLNSLLILSQLLANNKEKNLTKKQLECAQTIYNAGSDLLTLINDILDLSKIEAGKLDLHPEHWKLKEMLAHCERTFRHVAENRHLKYILECAPGVDESMEFHTDPQRVRQVLNNLLSNAFKFTHQGSVTLRISLPADNSGIKHGTALMFEVIDTGIGIPADKLEHIFGAFQQVDGSTSRNYGGTGLGLSISRRLADRLGGSVTAHSETGHGSTFRFYLPFEMPADDGQDALTQPLPESGENPLTHKIVKTPLAPAVEQKKTLLIIEDDEKFAAILSDTGEQYGFNCILAENGRSGLEMARNALPDAIILDVALPILDGWSVMEELQEDPHTRHIPVHFMSAHAGIEEAERLGAIGFIMKPLELAELEKAFGRIEDFIRKPMNKLLIVSDNLQNEEDIMQLAGYGGEEPVLAGTYKEAVKQLKQGGFDGVLLDAGSENGQSMGLLKLLAEDRSLAALPILVYANQALNPEQKHLFKQYAEKLDLKPIQSPEQLLNEVKLFLQQTTGHSMPQIDDEDAETPPVKEKTGRIESKPQMLYGRKVLLADDDIRNIFAVSSVLDELGIDVLTALNGREALDLLSEHPDADLVLMDIMMPEMDGYEAISQIRAQIRFRNLPIIALTAKAMKGDRGKCLKAGANDYLSKPVNMDKLQSLVRVWLYR